MSKQFLQTPSEALFEYVADLIVNHHIFPRLEKEGATIVNGYLVWPLDTEDEDLIYMAVNPITRQVWELDSATQTPPGGIFIKSDEDMVWVLCDLSDFVDQTLMENAFISPLPPEARYVEGCTPGFLHSLS